MIEQTILSGIALNEDYMRKVIPFLDSDYFENVDDRYLYQKIKDFIEKYNGLPTKEALKISIDNDGVLNEDRYKNVINKIDSFEYNPKTDLNWLVDTTEKFCKERALINAIRESILILDGKHKTLDKGSIIQLMSSALAVTFDANVGHDFLQDFEDRYDFYHRKEEKIPFNLKYLNDITKGGLSKKSLSIVLAGTGVGKSLFMCSCAAGNLMAGKNVLYITMEMAEERIAERIDANLLDVTLDDLRVMPREVYDRKIKRVKERTTGNLIIKEYPTASAGSSHFRHLLNELRLKKNFVPDVIYIDYLNICISSRLKGAANVNSYTYIKAIAEELRGLAVEFNVPIVSATQTTRSGYSSTDLSLGDTSESFGLPATADFFIALSTSDELKALNQILVKQLKNRWGDINYHERFVVGIDRAKMRLYDAEESAQDDIIQHNYSTDRPVMSNSKFGAAQEAQDFDLKKKTKPNFEGFA